MLKLIDSKMQQLNFDDNMVLMITTPEAVRTLEVVLMITTFEIKQILNLAKMVKYA